jgi:rod shape-determining protein MreB
MVFRRIFDHFSTDLAIDLGTANTLIYVVGKGIVLDEPSVVAVRSNGEKGNKVIAAGSEAKMMLGRTPENIRVFRPLRDGVIADFEAAEAMLRQFIRKALNHPGFIRSRVLISVASGITPVERRAVHQSAEAAGAREVFLIPRPVAAAIGAGLPVTKPTGSMVLDIGGGTTEVAVISLAGIVYSRFVRVAGDKMDVAIAQYVRRQYNLLVGEQTAELIKTTVGDAYEDGDSGEILPVKGLDLAKGLPKIIEINSNEIRQCINEQLISIIDTVKIALENTPPELSGDIVERGIVLTGGGALLKNIDRRLSTETALPVTIAEEPLTTVVRGCGMAFESPDLFRQVVV